MTKRGSGLAIGVITYCCWGLMPLLLQALKPTPVPTILCLRIIWSLPLLLILAVVTGRGRLVVSTLRNRRSFWTLVVSAMLIGGNWLLYIAGVNANRILEVSLGYFLIPFISAAAGARFLEEKLDRLSIAAIILAGIAVASLIAEQGHFPLLSVTLAASFVLYAFIRKTANVDALEGITIETILMFPCAAIWLAAFAPVPLVAGGLSFAAVSLATGAMALPMLFFTIAAKRMRLSDLGFLQYISPIIQLVLAVTVFGERPKPHQIAVFCLMGAALVLYGVSHWNAAKRPDEIVPT